MTPNLLPDVWLTAARAPHQPAARLVDNKNISALLKISAATRKQFCTDYIYRLYLLLGRSLWRQRGSCPLSGLHLLRPGHMLGFVSTPRHRTRDIESMWRAFFIRCQRGDAAAAAVMGYWKFWCQMICFPQFTFQMRPSRQLWQERCSYKSYFNSRNYVKKWN